MKKSLLLLMLLIGTLLAACAASTSKELLGDWKLVSYGSTSNPTPAAPNVETSLTLGSDGKVGGSMGCNSFGGDYKAGKGTITFGAIAATEMACEESLMQQEAAIFSIFSGTTSFKVEGNTLTITSTDGNSAAVFAKK